MICHGCQQPIPEGDTLTLLGENYCQDCANERLTVDSPIAKKPSQFHVYGHEPEPILTFDHEEKRILVGESYSASEAAELLLEHVAAWTGWELEAPA